LIWINLVRSKTMTTKETLVDALGMAADALKDIADGGGF
jgi:hypothetical protein